MPRYRVRTFYSTYIEQEIEAPSHDEAIFQARRKGDELIDALLNDLKPDENDGYGAELISNLAHWKEADESERLDLTKEKKR